MNYSGARFLASAAVIASACLLAFVVAYWGVRALAPAVVHVPPAAPADPVATLLASGLMRAPGAPPPVEAKKEESTLAGDMRLLGVFAEREGQGYALFRMSSGPRLVAQGKEIAQGATLVAVRPDGITIRDAGGERRIALRGEPAAKPAPAPAATVASRSARHPACAPPPGFKGTILRLNAELFQGIIGKPESWAAMVAPDQGALAVRDDSGFVTMLAMKKGDRLLQANGIPLSAPDDIARAVLTPLASQQAVRVTGTRDGAPREWLLLNAGTCPA